MSMQKVIDQIDYDFDQFSLDSFISKVGEWGHTEIKLCVCDLYSNLNAFGAYIPISDGLQMIFVDENLPHLHRLSTILHEIGHYVLGHEAMTYEELCLLRGRNLKAIFRRDDSADEREAELFAHTIISKVQDNMSYSRFRASCVPVGDTYKRYFEGLGIL